MHLPTILLTLLPTLTLSALISPRQLLATGQTVKQDVINIHNAVLALDSTAQSVQSSPIPTSLIEGTPVLFGVVKIHQVNRAGFRNALRATPFTVRDSRDVVDTVVNTVNLSIPKSIERLKAKAPAFKEGGLTASVIASLKLLLYDHDTFSAATIAKLNPGVEAGKMKEGSDAVANIHNAIQGGIEFFAANLV